VCRASPSQKSHVVQLVKKYIPSATSLSIGDGSNDVPMIKQANIGVGIKGKEGTEAAANSDYSIAQFKFVRTLLFNHGRPFASRLRMFILIFLHSNFYIATTSFMLGLYSAYSGQTPWEDVHYTLFQLAFTTINIACYLGFDYDIKKEFLDSEAVETIQPWVFKEQRDRFTLTFKEYLCSVAWSFIGLLLIFYIPFKGF